MEIIKHLVSIFLFYSFAALCFCTPYFPISNTYEAHLLFLLIGAAVSVSKMSTEYCEVYNINRLQSLQDCITTSFTDVGTYFIAVPITLLPIMVSQNAPDMFNLEVVYFGTVSLSVFLINELLVEDYNFYLPEPTGLFLSLLTLIYFCI